MKIDKRQIRRIVSECVINKMIKEELAFPEALEPELIELYKRYKQTTDRNEKEALANEICNFIDNRGKSIDN